MKTRSKTSIVVLAVEIAAIVILHALKINSPAKDINLMSSNPGNVHPRQQVYQVPSLYSTVVNLK